MEHVSNLLEQTYRDADTCQDIGKYRHNLLNQTKIPDISPKPKPRIWRVILTIMSILVKISTSISLCEIEMR